LVILTQIGLLFIKVFGTTKNAVIYGWYMQK